MSRFLPLAAGSAAMTCVGGSVAVSAELAGAPLFTVQALRYALACLLLLAFATLIRTRPVRPRGAEWLWLTGIAATGLIIFNLALVQGARHAEPAVLGVAVACVPVLLAALGPLLEGRGPTPTVLTGALVVTAGAALVQGVGRTDTTGLAWAVVAFACEAAFTLLAVPVLGRHGPIGVSIHTTWLAAVLLAGLGIVHEGPTAIRQLTRAHLAAGAYLAIAVTAVAFVLWYACVSKVGAGKAGLLTGIAPIAAAAAGVALGGPPPRPLVWAGIAVVGLGLAIGLRSLRLPTPPVSTIPDNQPPPTPGGIPSTPPQPTPASTTGIPPQPTPASTTGTRPQPTPAGTAGTRPQPTPAGTAGTRSQPTLDGIPTTPPHPTPSRATPPRAPAWK